MPRLLSIHYTLRDPAGRVLDLSHGGEPLSYLEGAGQIIDGLDRRLRAAQPGEQLTVHVPAAEAYGLPDPGQVQTLPRSSIPVDGPLTVGDRFQAGPDHYAPVLTVVRVEGDEITLDANHPLAGVDLTFEVQVVAARAATAEEIAAASGAGRDTGERGGN